MKGIIYMYTSPSGKKYIGQTIDEERRKSEFLNLNHPYAGYKINNARLKYGVSNFKYQILEEIESDNIENLLECLNKKEEEYIKRYDTIKEGYNLLDMGDVGVSKLLYESRERMKKTLKDLYSNRKGTFNGKHHSKESKEKISCKLKEYYKNHNSPWKGKKHSKEVKEKISEYASKRIGNKNSFWKHNHSEDVKNKISQKNSKAVLQIDINTNKIIREFNSIKEASDFFGKDSSSISKVCKDTYRSKTAFGYKWKYK